MIPSQPALRRQVIRRWQSMPLLRARFAWTTSVSQGTPALSRTPAMLPTSRRIMTQPKLGMWLPSCVERTTGRITLLICRLTRRFFLGPQRLRQPDLALSLLRTQAARCRHLVVQIPTDRPAISTYRLSRQELEMEPLRTATRLRMSMVTQQSAAPAATPIAHIFRGTAFICCRQGTTLLAAPT